MKFLKTLKQYKESFEESNTCPECLENTADCVCVGDTGSEDFYTSYKDWEQPEEELDGLESELDPELSDDDFVDEDPMGTDLADDADLDPELDDVSEEGELCDYCDELPKADGDLCEKCKEELYG